LNVSVILHKAPFLGVRFYHWTHLEGQNQFIAVKQTVLMNMS